MVREILSFTGRLATRILGEPIQRGQPETLYRKPRGTSPQADAGRAGALFDVTRFNLIRGMFGIDWLFGPGAMQPCVGQRRGIAPKGRNKSAQGNALGGTGNALGLAPKGRDKSGWPGQRRGISPEGAGQISPGQRPGWSGQRRGIAPKGRTNSQGNALGGQGNAVGLAPKGRNKSAQGSALWHG